MSKAEEESIFQEISTEEEAQNYILDQIKRLKELRVKCGPISGGVGVAVSMDHQGRAYDRFKTYYGQALGSLLTLMRCRKLSNGAYIRLKAALIETTKRAITGNFQ